MEPYVVLARRYRPMSFGAVLGQEASARTLVHAIESGRVAHAYLFSGPRGIGKTSMARILSKALCCLKSDGPTPEPCGECEVCVQVARGEDLDVIEIDGASNRGIDEVRALRDNARFAPARARVKIYIIDEVHMLTEQAFNALLKILEEPPAHVKFIFATTEPQKVPTTILSRCQRFDFRRIPVRTIAKHLETICREEGVEAPEEVLLAVAQASAGGMRDAQSILDQLITLGEGTLLVSDLEHLLGTVSAGRLEETFRVVGEGDEKQALTIYAEVHDQGIDPAEFLAQAIETARRMMVLLSCGRETDLLELTQESQLTLAEVAGQWGLPKILYGMGLLSDTLKSVLAMGQGRALVELALVKLSRADRLRSLDDIVADLRDLESKLGPGRAAPGGTPAPAAGPAAPSESRTLFRDAEDAGGMSADEESVGLTMDGVRARWDEIRERVKQRSTAVGTFLDPARIVGLEDDAITVGFAPAARFQMAQLEDSDHVAVIETEISEVLGSHLRLKTVRTEDAAEASEEEGGVPERAPADRGVTRAEMEKIQREPIVNTLKNLFMARLIHIERT